MVKGRFMVVRRCKEGMGGEGGGEEREEEGRREMQCGCYMQ